MYTYDTAAKELLTRIMEYSENGAPVELSIGYTYNQKCYPGIVIKKAPSPFVKKIVRDEHVFMCHLEADGLHLILHPVEE